MALVRKAFLAAIFPAIGTLALGDSAMAADDALAPGKPAGIEKAQIVGDPGFYIVFGLGLIGTGIAIAASSYHKSATSTSTTTTSSTATSP